MTKDAISLLKDDHKTVKGLLKELTEAERPDKRSELLAKIKMEVEIHSKVEQEIFYPEFSRRMDNKDGRVMVLESEEEHLMAARAIEDCEEVDPASETFEGRATVLKELIEHHAEDEEEEMFPMAEDVMKKNTLERLGQEMEARKKELQQKWEKEQTV